MRPFHVVLDPGDFNFERIDAGVKLLDRHRVEILLRERDHVDGEWHDVAIFGLLADEFEAAQAATA